MRRLVTTVVLSALLLTGCGGSEPAQSVSISSSPIAGHGHAGPPASIAEWARGAKLFANLGTFHRTVTTSSPDAQRYFDQGMRMLWAFNHDESTRSFAQAAALDAACALCYWGVALTVGPNYNLPMMADPRAKVAWEALQLAQQHAPRATPVEQALISALGRRYQGPQPLDPSNAGPVMTAYATEMRNVATKFSGDLDVQVLFAEALMNITPWKLWTLDGKPAPGTAEIQSVLERVLARDPAHPGANHYFIHTVEASPNPERALASAERLRGMMPDAGHLQHMPAHIFQRVGRYADAEQSNRDGVTADVSYLGAAPPLDYYPMYLAHNYQFLAYSAAMAGRSKEALEAVTKMKDAMPIEALLAMPGADWYMSERYTVMIRFGMWDEVLAEPAPDPRLQALTCGYHFARAIALAGKGRVNEARTSLTQLEKVVAALPADAGAGLNLAKDVVGVARLVAEAAIARGSGKADDAIARLREAVTKEDQLAYDEPADWFIPARHQLGALLLAAGNVREAEAVYRADLVRHPKNGWALFGLAQSLRAQKKDREAAAVDREFATAWKQADVKLTASVF
jgi:tetratricopeptide (TPR) repeat protein